MRGSQAGCNPPLSGNNEGFIRAPAAGGVALLLNHAKTVCRRAQILFITQHQVRLHGGTQSVDVAISMFAREHILSLCQWPEIIFLNETHGEIAIARVPTALVGEKQIFRQRISLIPSVGNDLVRPGSLLCTAQSFLGKIWQDRLRGAPVDVERIWILCELVSVDQATACFVVGVRRQVIIDVELTLGPNRFGKAANHASNLFLSRLRSSDSVRACQSREILSKTVPGDKRVKVISCIEVISVVVPPAHIGARSRQTFALAEGPE
jgi:hypothetical protein